MGTRDRRTVSQRESSVRACRFQPLYFTLTLRKENQLNRARPRGAQNASTENSKNTPCFKKTSPFYFFEKLAKYYPISIIFGSSIPEEICNKRLHVYPPQLFTVLIPYLVKF